MSERNIIKDPLTAAEIRSLSARVGGAVELVGPTKRREVEGMSDDAVVAWLQADPKRFRRPLIDLGDTVLLGFSKPVRAALDAR